MKRKYSTPNVTKYRSIADLPPQLRKELENKAFVVFDQDRRYSFVSAAFAQMLGYRPTELVGKRIDDITAENTLDISLIFDIFLMVGEMDGLWLYKHRDGGQVLMHFHARRELDLMYADVEPLPLAA